MEIFHFYIFSLIFWSYLSFTFSNFCPPQPCGPEQVPNNGKHSCPLTCHMYLNNTDPDDCAFKCESDFCVCEKGLVLNDVGKCVAPEECVGRVECNEAENEVWSNCGTDCEETCETYRGFVDPPDNNYRCVPNTCVCCDDHVRDSEGKCVPKDECPKKAECCENQQWTNCGTKCPQTCAIELGLGIHEGVCVDTCVPNTCECAPGFVLSTNGTCVEPCECPEAVQCGVNEKWTNCGPEIEKSCDDTRDPDYYEKMSECKRNTCVCLEGFVRDSDGVCVPESSCTPACGEHEVYTSCGTSCEPTCRSSLGLEPLKDCDSESSLNACVCKDGYVRDDDGICVPLAECPQSLNCGDNEVWTNCGKPQPETCGTLSSNKSVSVADSCILNTCECKPGYVRNDWGSCVLKSDCQKSCGKNEEWTNCGSSCPETCEIALGEKESPVCTMQCIINTCKCKSGYARDPNGICVALEDCPQAKTCHGNQQWTNCATKEDDCCDHATKQVALGKTYPDGKCKKNTCQCLDGYVRNSAGNCVLPSFCETKFACESNEIGVLIIDDLAAYGGNFTCQCRAGFTRNAQGNCMPCVTNLQTRPIGFLSKPNCKLNPSACAPVARCLDNEWLVHCGKNCYDTCAIMLGLETPTVCDGICYDHACECQPGFVRLTKHSRVCVPKTIEECRKHFTTITKHVVHHKYT